MCQRFTEFQSYQFNILFTRLLGCITLLLWKLLIAVQPWLLIKVCSNTLSISQQQTFTKMVHAGSFKGIHLRIQM